MDEMLTLAPAPEDDAQIQQAIAQCFAEIDRLRELMAQDQIEIDRSQAETWAILAELRTIVSASSRKAA